MAEEKPPVQKEFKDMTEDELYRMFYELNLALQIANNQLSMVTIELAKFRK